MLAIAGGKGGCGKTTTALGLARALATDDRTPLVVDADCDMPNVHAMAEAPVAPTIAAVAKGAPASAVASRPARFPGIRTLGAGDPGPTARGLAALDWPHGPTLVDCPAGADRTAATPLRVADRSVLVTLATRRSLTDTAKTAAMARALDAAPIVAVCTRTDSPPPCADVLDCEHVAAIPETTDRPLSTPEIRRGYRSISHSILRGNI
jgi:septum site-determining protein MinD